MSVSQSLLRAAADAALLRDATSRAAACRGELQAALDELVTADSETVVDRLLNLGRALVACDIDADHLRRLLDIVTADDAESCATRLATAELLTAAINQNRAGVEAVIAFCRGDRRRVVDLSQPVSLELVEWTLWNDATLELHFRLATHLLRMAGDPLYLAELELAAFGEPEELDGLPATYESETVTPPALQPSTAGADETAVDTQEPSPEPAGDLKPPPEPLLPDGPSDPLAFTWQGVTTNFNSGDLRYHRLLRIMWPRRRFAGGAMSLLDVAEGYVELTGAIESPGEETISKYARGLNRILARMGFPDELTVVDAHLVWQSRT